MIEIEINMSLVKDHSLHLWICKLVKMSHKMSHNYQPFADQRHRSIKIAIFCGNEHPGLQAMLWCSPGLQGFLTFWPIHTNCFFVSQMLHGAGILTYIETPIQSPSFLGKCTITKMEHLGMFTLWVKPIFSRRETEQCDTKQSRKAPWCRIGMDMLVPLEAPWKQQLPLAVFRSKPQCILLYIYICMYSFVYIYMYDYIS